MASEFRSAEWFRQPSLQWAHQTCLAFPDMQWTGFTVLSHLGPRKRLVSCHQKVWYQIKSPGLFQGKSFSPEGYWPSLASEMNGMSLEAPLFSCCLEEWGGAKFGHTLNWDNSHLMVRNLTKKVHGHQVCSNRVRSQMQTHWKDPTGLWTRLCHTDKLMSMGHGEQCAEKYKSKHPHG